MSIAYSIAREYLERSPFPIVALDLILNLPDTEGAEEEFFERFCKFIGDRQLSQIINATSIQYYSLFNKLHDMIRKILLDLDSSAIDDPSQLPNHQRKLLKCLTCIYDLVFICEDTSSLKIQTIFPEILEYISSVPHITSLYAIASILFFCKTASQTDFETYPKILFHGTPFMKFFDAYSMDLGSIFQLSDLSPKSVNSITNSYLNIAKYGKIILDFFQQEASNLIPEMPIKFLATQIIEKYSLVIEPSSYAYYELLGEILLGSYINESRIEDLVSVLTSIQSFCGIFLDFVYQKDEGAKYSVFPTSKLYQEFEPLPHPSIIDVIVEYFQKIMACETQEQQIPYMRKLHTIVKSLSLSLQMESYFANRKRYKPQFTRLLHKFLIPEGNNKEFGLWELICLGEELCQGITRSFSSVKEIKHFLLIEKYIPFEFYAEEILEYILEIVESSMLEITMQDEETSMEISLIMPEYYYAGRKLNDHFQKKCLSFNWTDNYMNVYLWRDYFLCLRAFFSIKENVNDGLVTKIFAKFEELVRLSAEEDFLDIIRNSTDPEALVKKHRYLLNLLKGEFRIIIAKEDIEGSPFQTLFNQIATSSLLDFLIDLSDKHKKDKASEEILQNCAHTFTFLHTLAQITYPDIDKITFYVEATVQAVSKLIMDFIKEPYKFYEVSCFFFQVLKDIDLLFKTFTLIPQHFEKLFTEILPDVNIHYQQLAHFFDPLLQHVFQVVHVINYQDPAEQEECVRYIKTFLRISKKVIETIKQDFLSHDFGSHTVQNDDGGGSFSPADKDSKITLTPHEQLVNQSFLCKIKSKVLLFGKIFRDILPNIEGLVFLAIPTNITEICELINDIFNNPILLYMEWSCMSRFLDSMKKICAHNEAFQKYTLERAFQNFLEITASLQNLVLDEDLPRDSERLQTLKGLINYHRDFWDYYKEHEVDVINYLGHKLLFSIVKLDTLALFFDYFFDAKGKVTMESLTPVLNKYETILQVCVKLETIFKFDILSGIAEAEPNKAGDLSSLESMNLYMKVLILYIFPSMLQGPAYLPFDTLKKLADFICENLDFVGLTKQEIKKDPTKLIRQMHVFSLMLAHFPIEHTHKYVNFRMFISIETVLGTVLQWIASLLKKFDKISNSKWQIISRLENLLSKFMKQLHIIMQDLYKIPSAVITDSWSSLEKVKEKEREYYTYLCDMIKTDFPYYENFSSKDTLYKIFNSLHYFIETMNKYQYFHRYYKKTKAKKSKGKSRKDTQEDQANDLSGTMSNLSNEEFFEEMYEKLHDSFKLGLKTPCFLIFVLSNESVQNDIYTLFGAKYLETIENMLEGLLIKGAKEIKQENILIENKVVENTKINANNEVFLNFLFYKKKAQKSLRVIEYINVVLAVAVKHCQRFKERAGIFLDYSHEYGIEVLNNFSITSFMNLKGENTLQTLINCYNSLLSRVTLLSLYKVRLNMLKLNKDFQLRDQKIIDDSFEMVLKQFQLQSEFKKKILPQGLFIRETYEPYLFLFSLWWYNEDYIRRLMTKPDMIMLLLDNANSDLSLRFLVSIFTICGVNAFPASQICEIIVKGLTFSDQTGRLLLNSGRVDVYQEIVGKFMKQAIDYCFKIDPLKISLAHPDDSFGSVTLSEFPKTAGRRAANNKKGENSKPMERVPTYDYLLGGMNQVTKATLENLLEVYLQWFDEEVCAIYESRDWNKRIFHPIFIMSLLIYKFPELVPYLLSYPVKLDRYNFPKYFDINKVNPEMNFFEFMVRINFYYFPSFIFIHEFVCYNSRQPLAIQFAGETVLMHELFARFFLEEILKVLQEDLESQPENFCSTPQSIRKWGIYPTIAFHIFAMCSYKERTYIPIVMFEKYIKFILLCVATWRKNRPNGYYELVNPLFRLLRELAHFSLLQGMRVRLQKMDNDIPQKEWIWIQDYKKCMKLVKFLGKKSRDTVQKQAKEKKTQAMNVEEGNMEIEKEKTDNKKYDKEIPYLGNNFRDIKTSDVIHAPEFVSNYEPALKKFKWDSFTRNSKLPNEFVHNTGSVNIFTGYLGLFTKIHENMNKFTENFQNQTEELKETKRVFNILHSIDREYYILHTSHPKIMMFDWKTRFGIEPIDMFNYKAHIDAPSPKFFQFKDKLAQKLSSNTPSTTKKTTKKPLRKSELMNVISLIKTRGPKIKSRLHDFLEKSMLKSVHQVNWEPDTIQDVYKPKETLELAVFLKYQPKEERHVMFYLMDDVTFEKLPPAIKEKGKAIKKLVEKEMKNQLNFDEDELEDEPNEEEELRHRTILRILDSPATIQRTIGSADFIPNTTDLSPQALNNHVVPNNVPEKPKKIEVEEPARPPSRRGGRRGGRRRGSSAGRRGKNTPRNKRNNDADYITDEETEETNHEDNRKASTSAAARDEDYGSERGDEDSNPAEMEMQKELLKDLMNSFKRLEEGKTTGNNTDEEEERGSDDDESEADDAVPFEELEDEPEEEEDGHDFDGLSFCTNSDVSEVFYEEYADFKANEEIVMERIYTNHLSEYNILDNFHSVIITLDQEAITNVISFFASEHYYDFRYPTVELNNNVETYYRQLELLMINPGNQVKVLHTLSFAISAPLESLNIPTLSQHNHLNFTMNILQFLHFYVRANPQSFFISDTDDLQEYNSYIDVITVPDLPKEVLAIKEMNLVTRLLTLFSKKCTEKHELLARKIVNLLCFLAKVSCDRKYMLTLGDYELNLLNQIIISRHCLESPVFRKRVGKLFRHLGRVAEYKDVFLHIEKKIVQDESQELISLLTDKYDQINQYYKKNLGGVKSLSFEDVKNINNILLCPKLELYQEILRCLDDHLAANINTMLIINFIEKMKESGQINKMISMICQILIMMKKIKELNQIDFPMVIPSVEAYIFSLAYMYYLLRQAKNLGDVKLKSLKSLTTKNSVQLAEELELEKFEDELNNENLLEKLEELALYTKDLIGLVFKANLSKISKDSRVLQILSALNVIPSLATKEKVMRMYFSPGLSEESQFILPLTIRRNSILSDSLRAIDQNYAKLKRPSTSLKITFAKEAGVDEGGLKKEWLALLINGIFDPKIGLFRLSHNQRCLYPNPSSFVVPKALSLFKTAGIFIGLSIKENIPTGISFTRGFLRAILSKNFLY